MITVHTYQIFSDRPQPVSKLWRLLNFSTVSNRRGKSSRGSYCTVPCGDPAENRKLLKGRFVDFGAKGARVSLS